MRQKYSPVILQTLGGAPQRDFEYEKRLQDFKEVKDRLMSLKKVIDNFPVKLQEFKKVLDTISYSCELIFDKNQKDCYQFMHNISSAHRALSEKLSLLCSQFTQIQNNSNIWKKEIEDVKNKIKLRTQCLEKYYHYEKKLFDLNDDRMKEIRKNNKVSESDHERFIRNIGKFQKSGKELIFATNSSFKAIEQFMNNRYDRVIMTMANLVEAERGFFTEANHIMNFFVNVKNNAFNLKQSYVITNTKYDASLYIKGRAILNMSVDEIFNSNYNAPPPQPQQGNNYNNYNNNTGNNNDNNNTRGIINPFTAESKDNDFGNNNNMGYMSNDFGNNFNNNNNPKKFINKSTRETYANINPYNTQINSFPGNNNNDFGNNKIFENNNMNTPYMPKDSYNPFQSNNNGNGPYGGGNNNFNNNTNNKNDPWGDNNNNNQNQNNNNKDDDDPFNF